MRKLFATDFKRLLQSRTSIIITIIAPLILVVLISLTIAPLYFSDVRLDYFHITVLNEDEDPTTRMIANSLIKSDTLKGLIDVKFVKSKQDGLDSLDEGSVAFIHIPPGLQDSLYEGDQVTINYYGNKNRPLENALVLETLVPGIELVNYSQNAVNELYFSIKPYDKQLASDIFFETSAYLLINGMAIDDVYAPTQEYSPLSDILPVEFYAACVLLLFVALGALPIARITQDDKKAGLLQRQLIGGISASKSFVSKWLAGTLMLFIQYAVLCFALLIITGRLSYFAGNAALILGCAVLFCAMVSLTMMVIGLLSKSAVYISLTVTLLLAALGGLIIPIRIHAADNEGCLGIYAFCPCTAAWHSRDVQCAGRKHRCLFRCDGGIYRRSAAYRYKELYEEREMSMLPATFKYRLKSSIRSARGIVSLVLALVIAAIPFIGLSSPDAPIPIGWIDEDNSQFSQMLRERVDSIELLYIDEEPDEQKLVSKLQTGQLEGVMKIPEGFEEMLLDGEYEDTLIMMTSPYSTAFEIVSESVSRKVMELWVASYTADAAGDIAGQDAYDTVMQNTLANDFEPILVLNQMSGSTDVPVDAAAPVEEAAYKSLYLLCAFACFYMLTGLVNTNEKDFNQRLLSRAVTIEKYRLALVSADALLLLPCVLPALIGFAAAGKPGLILPFAVLFALYLFAYGGIASLVSKISSRTTLMLTITLVAIVNLFLGSMLLELPALGIISKLSYMLPSRWMSSADTLGVWWCMLGMLGCAAAYNALPFIFRSRSD